MSRSDAEPGDCLMAIYDDDDDFDGAYNWNQCIDDDDDIVTTKGMEWKVKCPHEGSQVDWGLSPVPQEKLTAKRDWQIKSGFSSI